MSTTTTQVGTRQSPAQKLEKHNPPNKQTSSLPSRLSSSSPPSFTPLSSHRTKTSQPTISCKQTPRSNNGRRNKTIWSRLGTFLRITWLLTESNLPTFVGPNTVFALATALSGPSMISAPTSSPLTLSWLLAYRLLPIFLFNQTNLFIFDFANQRLPESAEEDKLNKPWRPVPSGLLTSDDLRRLMLYLIPAVVLFNHFVLGTGIESLVIMSLTWMYNDLRGGDEGFATRNAIIAVAFAVFNAGGVKVAVNTNGLLSTTSYYASAATTNTGGLFGGLAPKGVAWTVLVSAIIFTTMQVQDLQDAEGDRVRGRRSAPIVMGDRVARWSVAGPMMVWPGVCAWLCWSRDFYSSTATPTPPLSTVEGSTSIPGPPSLRATTTTTTTAQDVAKFLVINGPQMVVGAMVAVRCLTRSGLMQDKSTWRLWCLWTALLYTLPPISLYISGF